jgi:hypothetical protein
MVQGSARGYYPGKKEDQPSGPEFVCFFLPG